MVNSLLGVLLCLCIQISIGQEQPHTASKDESNWWDALGFTNKRPLRGDKEGFWAVRGKRSVNIGEPTPTVDDVVEHDLSVIDNAEEMGLSQEEQLYYMAMKNLIQEIQSVNDVDEHEALEMLYYVILQHDGPHPEMGDQFSQVKRGFIKPNGLFNTLGAGKRAIMKPNGMFTTLMKRSLKPNGLFALSHKRFTLKPNGLFGKRGGNFKPNSLFNIAGKRSQFKPNSLFNLAPKRSLKPNGLFVLKRVFKPNGLFTAIKRGGLKPNGLFNTYKRSVDTTIDLDSDDSMLKELMIKKDKGFWAVRGKKDDDFWAVRGKKDDDFWAVRGKKSADLEDEQDED